MMELMTQVYYIKNLWRFDAGLIELPAMMNAWMKKQEEIAQRNMHILKTSPT